LGYGLEKARSYLILEERPNLAFKILNDYASKGYSGLCITREYPETLRREYGLKGVQIYWLTDLPVSGERCVRNLLDISLLIESFLNSASNPIILIDGLEYLISREGFDATYHFIQRKRNQVSVHDAILLLSCSPKAIEEEKLALLTRELVRL